DCVTWLKNEAGFGHLVVISVVDRIERGVFEMVYLLHSYGQHRDIGVKTEIDRENASMESVHRLWAGAKVYQREIREMFGIDFPGSPGVEVPMILESWTDMPPMRRDFDTKEYSEKTYFPREGRKTSDPARYMASKRYEDDDMVGSSIKELVRSRRKRQDGDE
ncbi:MAG TPA: NADH-quinone oxidoreductase subunit C, partial [Candidatus Krumholzibacterium sp.]|nr:NADH-quinone oxidoreductase subunit C [Candidatus Krumholzibacterium sp.]